MPFVPCANCFLAVEHFLLFGQDCENTLWFRADSPTTPAADALAINNMVSSWVIASYLPLVSSDVTYILSVVTDQSIVTGAESAESFGVDTGGVPTSAQPGGTSFTVSF